MCRSGFSGDDCSALLPSRLQPEGTLRGRALRVQSRLQWRGLWGELPDCSQRGPLRGMGAACTFSYTGDDCGVRSCAPRLQPEGALRGQACICDPGYSGDDCGSRTDLPVGLWRGRALCGRPLRVLSPGTRARTAARGPVPATVRAEGVARMADASAIRYSGDIAACAAARSDCNQRGRCEPSRCVCWPEPGAPTAGARPAHGAVGATQALSGAACACATRATVARTAACSCPGLSRPGPLPSGRCVCWPGYTGRDCGRSAPALATCRGRRRCVDGRCVCSRSFAGRWLGRPSVSQGTVAVTAAAPKMACAACDVDSEAELRPQLPQGLPRPRPVPGGRCVCDDGYEVRTAA